MATRSQPLHVALLSPHRDDAAFSCGLLATRLLRAGASVHVVNVCTESAYAPYLGGAVAGPEDGPERVREVSRVRRAEDEAFLRMLVERAGAPGEPPVARVAMTDLHWLDSPLRLHIAADRVREVEAVAESEVAALAEALGPWRGADAVLAPLALGDHIDHRLVCAAASRAMAPERLGWYEDLPYGCWMTAAERHEAVERSLQRHGAEGCVPWIGTGAVSPAQPPFPAQLPFPAQPLSPAQPLPPGLKRQYALCYSSQIAPDLADLMEADAVAMQAGERLHVPASLAAVLTAALRGSSA